VSDARNDNTITNAGMTSRKREEEKDACILYSSLTIVHSRLMSR